MLAPAGKNLNFKYLSHLMFERFSAATANRFSKSLFQNPARGERQDAILMSGTVRTYASGVSPTEKYVQSG
jgi:hypothetical protein